MLSARVIAGDPGEARLRVSGSEALPLGACLCDSYLDRAGSAVSRESLRLTQTIDSAPLARYGDSLDLLAMRSSCTHPRVLAAVALVAKGVMAS